MVHCIHLLAKACDLHLVEVSLFQMFARQDRALIFQRIAWSLLEDPGA